MSVTPASATADLVRLATEAKRRGLQIFLEEATGSYFCTSHRAPDRLYRVTAVSCGCKGFMQWQRCTHLARLHAELGWLADSDPDPSSPGTAALPAVEPAEREVLASTAPLTILRPREATAPQEAEPAPVTPVSPPALTDPEERAATMQAAIDGAVERLAGQLEQGYTVEFRELLTFYSRFHSYSWANTWLIRWQCPEASLVAGLRRWTDQGYHVRKGERAIWIWAPLIRLVEDPETGGKAERLVGFRPAPVFDASQLANLAEKPLPSPMKALPDDAQALYRAIRDRVVQSGIAVQEGPLPRGVYGTSSGGSIEIASGIDSRLSVLTLLHELTHELAHSGDNRGTATREQQELEAESVSYIVGLILGIENPNSSDYICNWAGTAEQLRASLGTIQRLVKQVVRIVLPSETPVRRAA